MQYLELLWDNRRIVMTNQKQTVEIDNESGELCLKTVTAIVEASAQFGEYENIVIRQLADPVFTEAGKTYDFVQLLSEATRHVCVMADDTNDVDHLCRQGVEDFIWKLKYVGYHPGKDEYAVESLLTVGNGYFGLRGTLPEMKISDSHYPATYLAGLYNQAKSKIGEATIWNEDFVNAPNAQYLNVKVDGELAQITPQTVCSLTRTLNMKNGLFASDIVLQLSSGKRLRIQTTKVANMQDTKEYVLQYSVTPLNFFGEFEIVSEIDASVYNYNVERYRSLERHHLDLIQLEASGAHALCVVRTKQSQFTIIQKTALMGEVVDDARIQCVRDDERIIQSFKVNAQMGQRVTVEKYVHMDCLDAWHLSNLRSYIQAPCHPRSFQIVLAQSTKAWEELWQKADIVIEGDIMSQKLLHLHTYHLLVSGLPNGNDQVDASITARGLHGEAYRGHIFWDEIFIMPFYILHFPNTAKQLLMYRYHRLQAAKNAAKEAGYQGSMFPWQSGLDGTEQSQEIHLNPMTGKWDKDFSRLQRHVSLAIAYNVWLYWHITHDQAYMEQYGAELLLEIAHFWQSAASFDEHTGRYNIDKVMGPDEFHETYPGCEEGGLKNNAYTNMMVVWLFACIEQLKAFLPHTIFQAIMKKTAIQTTDLVQMNDIKTKLALDINEQGIIGQYEGYFELKELDWDYYRQKYGNIYRMDRILRAEGLSADDYKVAKQADTLMIFYNFSKKKVDRILADLRYVLPKDYLDKNLRYYLARTSHGSTLSRVVHAQLAAMVGEEDMAWQLYQEALYSDYQDIQGGTTAEGIHTGVMAGTIYITLTTFAGIDIREKMLQVAPHLPKQWSRLRFSLEICQTHYTFDIQQDACWIKASQNTTIIYKGRQVVLKASQTQKL